MTLNTWQKLFVNRRPLEKLFDIYCAHNIWCLVRHKGIFDKILKIWSISVVKLMLCRRLVLTWGQWHHYGEGVNGDTCPPNLQMGTFWDRCRSEEILGSKKWGYIERNTRNRHAARLFWISALLAAAPQKILACLGVAGWFYTTYQLDAWRSG